MKTRLKDGVACQVVDGQVVAVSPDGEKVYLLDKPALRLWQALSEGVETAELTPEEATCAAYLASKGLVEAEPQANPPSCHPWVLSEEQVEVMAALCDSSRLGGGAKKEKPGKCRVFGSCQKPFE